MKIKTIVAPSVLAADFAHLAEAEAEIDASGAEWTHLDVMDGSFVPNITFGSKMVKDLRPHSSSVFDVHLMTSHPDALIPSLAEAGADNLTFHVETAIHAHRLVGLIKKLGKKAGVAIVPSTPVSALTELLPDLDLVLVMTVDPGWGGQKLIPACLEKARRLADLRKERGYTYLVSIDGGVNPDTARDARSAGVDVLVAGEAFFRAPDKKALVNALKGENSRE